jgi:hypothetical protein
VSERIEKSWGDVLAAVHGHHKGLVGEGIVDPERVRMTVEARKEAARKLRANGFSERKIAAALNEPKSTIHADLAVPNPGQNMPDPGQKHSTRALLSQSDQNDWRTPRKYLMHRHISARRSSFANVH